MSYEYNIWPEYSREQFKKTVDILKKKVKNIKEMKYIEDPLDGDQIQIITTEDGEIVVKNDFMVGAVWIESEIEKLTQITNGSAWDFSNEKQYHVFAENDILVLRPLTEEYYDLYIKTRAIYAYNHNFYLDPDKREFVLSEFNQEECFFLAVIRKSDNAYIGYVGLKDTRKNLWEFCIELLPECCNQGYGFSAVKLFLKEISQITRNDKQQFMALVEVDNIPSQKLMLKLGGRLIDIYDSIFHDEERAEKFEEEHLDEITDHMMELAEELMVEPRKLLSHVLDYRIFAEKL
ncbi:MAG: GNAT family N-acetyltransferase [Clostridia bacterium]|nr:GNAT family N-acetyltransferase [Clostridia bacterium]